MELKEYVAIVRKWLWLMVLCAAVAGVSSYIGTRGMPRIYQSTTTVMVGQNIQAPDPSSMDIWTSQQLAQTYATLVSREPIRKAAAQALGLQYVPSAGTISARMVEGTQLVEISVRDTDPERARALADEIAQQLILQTPSAAPEEAERRAFVQKQLVDLEGKIEQTQRDVQDEQARLDAANSARAIQQYQANITALQQRLATYQSTYASLVNIVQGGSNYISVVEPAYTPTTPISPNVQMNVLLAAAIGLALAVAGAFLSEYIDDTIKTPEDATRLTNLPTLGVISRIEGHNYPEKLVTVRQPLSPIAESYRILRTNIQYASIDKPLRTLMLTSPSPGEGKSMTLANLAVVLAQSGLRVIAVDTDLRRPVLHRIFDLPNNDGLCEELLMPTVNINGVVQRTEVAGLSVVTSGSLPPNPAELLGSERFQKIVERLKELSDVVLFDSPPSLVVADAAILSNRVDAVLVVNDANHTRRGMSRQGVEELRRIRANVIGVVLNQMKAPRGGYYYYYYTHRDGERERRHRRRPLLKRLLPFLYPSSRGSGKSS